MELASSGTFKTDEGALCEYNFPSDRGVVKLYIDNWAFSSDGISQLVEFLESLKLTME